MFKNYLTTAWRNIITNSLFSAINLFGLALGLMACILITLFVREETGYDTWLADSDRVVRMHTAYLNPGSPPLLTVRSAGKMMEGVSDFASAEVASGTRILNFPMSIIQQNEKAQAQTVTTENISLVEQSFFQVFDLPFIHGSRESSFTKPLDFVMTASMAQKYFGRTDVIGETLSMCCVGPDISEVTVSGVIEDLPDATHLNTQMITFVPPAMFKEHPAINSWNNVNVYTYFKMKKGISIEQFQARLTYWVDNESIFKKNVDSGEKASDTIKHKLMALEDLHLHAKKDAGTMGDLSTMGDANMIAAFVIIASLILLIACINFMNLATARASQRAKEVAMRKVLGASRAQVMMQFLAEAVALVFMSLLLALTMVELVLPFYNSLLNRDLAFSLFNDMRLFGAIVGVGLLVGLGAGLYPAIYLSKFRPGHILKSNKSSESGKTAGFRTFLVIFQFSASIALVISTIVIYGQTHFAQSVDLGFESENKMVLAINAARDQRASLKQEIQALPQVTSVVFSSEAPSQDNENNRPFKLIGGNALNNDDQLLNYHNMDYGFFEAYEVQPIAGRLFSESFGNDEMNSGDAVESDELRTASAIINQSSLSRFGFSDAQEAIGETLRSNFNGVYEFEIVGVIPDILFRSIKHAVRPTIYTLNPNSLNVATISYTTDNPAALRTQVESIWQRYAPLFPAEIQFLDSMMDAQYVDERTQAQLFSAFSLLTIVIACLGLYGLAAFTTERRTKEIGVRKVMGASVTDIVKLLVWQFSKPVLIANLVAWPLATYFMLNWLENFSYRIASIWLLPICLSVGALLMIVAWLTVGGNAASVARTNPNVALRHD